MSSLQADFNELLRRVEAGREFTHASFEPIFYLVFDPREILDVKRNTPAWQARLENDGWDVHTFSIADQVADILEKAPCVISGSQATGKLRWNGGGPTAHSRTH